MNMTPKRIPIPSDLVLKVSINDLYDKDAEPIDITDVTAIKLIFSAGGASKSFDVNPDDETQNSSGVTLVEPDGANAEDPYIIVCLCTQNLRPGQLTLRSEVSIPDTRFHNNIRKEVDEYEFPIILT